MILILVVAVYQQILSTTEQGFIGLLRGNQTSMGGAVALGVGHSFLCRREGVGHVFVINHISKCSGPTPPSYTF